MKINFLVLLVLFTFTTISQTWGVELRPTLHIPSKDVLEQPLRLGNGLALTGILSLGERVDVYGGLTWNRFDTDEENPEMDIEFIQKGFLLGGIVYFSFIETQRSPFYLRAGLSLMTVEAESTQEEFDITTNAALGTHLGAGIKITSLGKWFVLPEIQFSNSSYRYRDTGDNHFLSFRYVSITAAIRRSF